MGTQAVEPYCMIVDDDPIFVAVLEQSLHHIGFTNIFTANDGQEAFAILQEHHDKITAITLDLNMPNEDGIGFLRLASTLKFGGKFFLSSGEDQTVIDGALRLARMLGLFCGEPLSKPIEFDKLAGMVAVAHETPNIVHTQITDKAEIELALDSLKIEAFFQSRIRLEDGSISGAEVLARIKDLEGNYINTQDAIDHAERTGRIESLTWKMLDNLIEAVQLFPPAANNMRFSININGQVLIAEGFTAKLLENMTKSNMEPSRLILEITETGLPPDPAQALETMTRLRMAGFGLAIDDFGTGYSNIESLQIYPFTELKVDKSFMQNAQKDAFSRECVVTSIKLAKQLNLEVVVEGVETQYDEQFIRTLGAHQAQGYYYAKPEPVSAFINRISL